MRLDLSYMGQVDRDDHYLSVALFHDPDGHSLALMQQAPKRSCARGFRLKSGHGVNGTA